MSEAQAPAAPRVDAQTLRTRIQVQIDNKFGERRRLHEALLTIDAEINGLRDAQFIVDKMAEGR